MGNAQPSRFVSSQYPFRPYDPSKEHKRLCLMKNILLLPTAVSQMNTNSTNNNKKGSILHQLILLQDWQRVLIRAKLFPDELKQYSKLPISMHSSNNNKKNHENNDDDDELDANNNDEEDAVKVLPLHLVCALNPPVTVIHLFLDLYIDATAMPIQPIIESKAKKNTTNSIRSKMKRKQKNAKTATKLSSSRFLIGHPPHGLMMMSRTRWTLLGHRIQEWRRNRHGAFPVDESLIQYYEALHHPNYYYHHPTKGVLLPSSPTIEQDDDDDDDEVPISCHIESEPVEEIGFESMESDGQVDCDRDDEDEDASDSSMESSSLSTHKSFNNSYGIDNNIILQLSPSGGLHSFQSDDTGSTSSTESKSSSVDLFRVRWDFEPLYDLVIAHGLLLPIHLACFYSASPQVLKALVTAYSTGCLISIGGMLPIHWVAAGWKLPPLFPPPASNLPLPLQPTLEKDIVGPLEAFEILKSALPDTVKIKSGNHGLTPEDYVQECMEDSDYKVACLRYLTQNETEPNGLFNLRGDDRSLSTFGSFIFSNDANSFCLSESPLNTTTTTTTTTTTCLNTTTNANNNTLCMISLTSERDWDGVVAAVECDPSIASKWVYGMDEYAVSTCPVVWKRLPIHLACAYGAPVGVVSVLLRTYPSGVASVDLHDGSLPLHIACQKSCTSSVEVVRELLSMYPVATRATNRQGRVPLHVAVISRAPYGVIEELIEVDPKAAFALDDDGNKPIDYAKQIRNTSVEVLELLKVVHLLSDDKSL